MKKMVEMESEESGCENIEDRFFDEWNEVKKRTNLSGRVPTIKEGEVWWCAVGKNVGVEINGKNERYSRPVLVFKKLSRYGFLGVPLTSKEHAGTWYARFRFQGREQIAVLSQIRVMSVSRLYSKMGDIDDVDKMIVKEVFRKLYLPGDGDIV